MDKELKALIESREFDEYDKDLQARGFNPFDVLQVADMEIRHSNVLAWLLRPDGTHGVGGRFLRELVEHLARRHDASHLRTLSGFDDKDNVEIKREDHHDGWYADITVGFKAERVLLIIENKVVGWYPEAEKQAKAYQDALRKKYGRQYAHFPGVLLTTSSSPEGRDVQRDTRDIIPLRWDDVHGLIRSLLDDPENFADRHARAFVERYLDVIKEKLMTAGDDLAERLRDNHPGILERLQKKPALLNQVDEPHRATIERWMEYFQPRWTELRTALGARGRRPNQENGRSRRLGRRMAVLVGDAVRQEPGHRRVRLLFSFEPRKVTVELGTPLERDPRNPKLQEVWRFLQDTPIDSGKLDRYPMKAKHRVIYRHSLLNDPEHSRPFEESVKVLRDSMNEFFGRDGDYERIERYLKCLAFDPRGAEHFADGETAP